MTRTAHPTDLNSRSHDQATPALNLHTRDCGLVSFITILRAKPSDSSWGRSVAGAGICPPLSALEQGS